jgi:hypothetical protein
MEPAQGQSDGRHCNDASGERQGLEGPESELVTAEDGTLRSGRCEKPKVFVGLSPCEIMHEIRSIHEVSQLATGREQHRSAAMLANRE